MKAPLRVNHPTHRGKEVEIVKGAIDVQARRVLVALVKSLKAEPSGTTGDTAEQILQLLEEQGFSVQLPEKSGEWLNLRATDHSGSTLQISEATERKRRN